MNAINKQSGFIKWVILIIIVIIVLSYYGFDIQSIVESEQSQRNLNYVWGIVLNVWNNYLSQPVLWVWNNIVLFIWEDLFITNLERLRSSGGDFRSLTPDLPSVEY